MNAYTFRSLWKPSENTITGSCNFWMVQPDTLELFRDDEGIEPLDRHRDIEYSKACLKESVWAAKLTFIQNNIDLLPQKVSTNEELNPLRCGPRHRGLVRWGAQALQCPHTGFGLFHVINHINTTNYVAIGTHPQWCSRPLGPDTGGWLFPLFREWTRREAGNFQYRSGDARSPDEWFLWGKVRKDCWGSARLGYAIKKIKIRNIAMCIEYSASLRKRTLGIVF